MNVTIFFGEFLGLLVFVVVHGGIMASMVLNGKVKDGLAAFAVFAGITFGVYAAGASGGHINPAVTMAFLGHGDIDLIEALTYVGGQWLGGVAGAFVLYLMYRPQLKASANALAPFTANPNPKDTIQNVLTSLIGSFFLSLFVLFVANAGLNGLTPIAVGLAVTAAALLVGGTAYSELNIARDLGPRFTATLLGLGKPQWLNVLYLVAASLLGGLLAGFFYQALHGITILLPL